MNSVLFIRGGAIGDFILTLPGIHAFREQFPDARVEIMGYPHISQLAVGRFYAQGGSSLDRSTVASFFARNGKLDPALSGYFASFDLVVSFLYDPDRFFFENLKRAGVGKLIEADGRPAQSEHAMEHLARWLPHAGVSVQLQDPRVYSDEEDLLEAGKLLSDLNLRHVALHIGSGSPSKNWNTQGFVQLAESLLETGLRVVILDGPADEEARKLFLRSPVASRCIRINSIPLARLAALLKKCAVFVGHDSGISHLASAVGIPTVALFGPTDPSIWRPRGERVRIIQGVNEVSDIRVEEVLKEVKNLLN